MKIQYHIIAKPLLLIITIFIVGLAVIDNQLTNILNHHLEERLDRFSNLALLSVKNLSEPSISPFTDDQFDRMANELVKQNNMEISFFNKNGQILGDSSLTMDEIITHQKDNSTKELIQVLKHNTGQIQRHNDSLDNSFIYFTNSDVKSGY